MSDMEFISKAGLASELGISVETIKGWMSRHWTLGVQYMVIGHTTLIHKEEVSKWLISNYHLMDCTPRSRGGSKSVSVAKVSSIKRFD